MREGVAETLGASVVVISIPLTCVVAVDRIGGQP